MREWFDQFTEHVQQKSLLIRFAVMCGCVFVVIMWILLAIATGIWFFVILANALQNGAITLLWLIPWCGVASVIITLFLAALATGIFD